MCLLRLVTRVLVVGWLLLAAEVDGCCVAIPARLLLSKAVTLNLPGWPDCATSLLTEGER